VTSVQPVVGDFAVAHQPVITILPDGTNLNVTATVSADRRSVQMSLVPFFCEVVEVQTFTFTGTTRTERSTNSLLDDLLDNLDPTNADASDDEIQTVSEGVTIQLPVLATTSVNTVVSVPDGGTILLGGIKRMREERTERGVPMLSSIPYVNRLFTNTAVGRETTNLMMMVTPRIIIQAEEEKKQIGVFGDDE
jgi:general secretion pathway protein D